MPKINLIPSVFLHAPKNTLAEKQYLTSFFPFLRISCQKNIFHRRDSLNVFWNVDEKEVIECVEKGIPFMAFALEPPHLLPDNYNWDLLRMAELYASYSQLTTPACINHLKINAPAGDIRLINSLIDARNSLISRDYDFIIFANHDPNIRILISSMIADLNSELLGPLFKKRVPCKEDYQLRSKYEFITENYISDFYISEKVSQALLAGCIPIYHGSSKIHSIFPPECVIRIDQFGEPNQPETLRLVIDYCIDPENYAKHRNAVLSLGREFFNDNHSFEGCFVGPVCKALSLISF